MDTNDLLHLLEVGVFCARGVGGGTARVACACSCAVEASAITTRGAKENFMVEIAEMIETVLNAPTDEQVIAEQKARFR